MKFSVVVLALLASSAFADKLDDELVKKMTEFTDAMCKCGAGDTACAQRVIDSQIKYADEVSKTPDRNRKPNPDIMKRIEPVMERYTKCATNAMTPKDPNAKPVPQRPTMTMTEVAKAIAGTWRCKGKMAGSEFTATITNIRAGSLDNAWIQSTSTSTSGKKTTKGVDYTREDDGTKTWYRTGVDSSGNAHWATSVGPANGRLAWEGEVRAGSTTIKYRSTDDFTNPKELVTTTEVSTDGKSWSTVVDGTCKR